MANFRPFKRYILYALDQLVREHRAVPPFLDVGCGVGDVSLHLASRHGWHGRAIDASDSAAAQAREALSAWPLVDVAGRSLADEHGNYSSIVMFDVLEHLEDDQGALAAVAARLAPGGYLFLTTPSNPREWRWDDEVYGHVRRYPPPALREKLEGAGLHVATLIDISLPVFWGMRRGYTRVLRPKRPVADSAWERTLASTSVNAWDVPVLGNLLESGDRLWDVIFAMQYRTFRHWTDWGCELMVAATRKADP